MKNELLIFGMDTPENIAKCLNCTKVRCNNCLTGRASKPRKTVLQCDRDTGEIIAAYESVREAARVMCITSAAIYNCIRNPCSTARGYKWRYEKEE